MKYPNLLPVMTIPHIIFFFKHICWFFKSNLICARMWLHKTAPTQQLYRVTKHCVARKHFITVCTILLKPVITYNAKSPQQYILSFLLTH